MSYDNKGRFGLWRNKDRKEKTHPHLSGQGEALDGDKVWVSAWFPSDMADDDKARLQAIIQRHSEKSSKPFLSVSIKAKQAGPKHNTETGTDVCSERLEPSIDYDDDYDSIPF